MLLTVTLQVFSREDHRGEQKTLTEGATGGEAHCADLAILHKTLNVYL